MLQTNLVATHNIELGIDYFIFFIMMCLHSYKTVVYTVAVFALDKNRKSKFRKKTIFRVLKKLLIFAYFSTFLENFLEKCLINVYIFDLYVILTFKS